MHKGCLLQQCCSYGPSKACAGIHAASLLHTACKKKLACRSEATRQIASKSRCVTLQRRGCRSNSGLEILRRTRSFPERTNSAGSVAAILWQLEIFVYRESAPGVQDALLRAEPGPGGADGRPGCAGSPGGRTPRWSSATASAWP